MSSRSKQRLPLIAEMTGESLCSGRRVSLRFQTFAANSEISSFGECCVKKINSNLLG
jgi:hypothetical protein